MSDLFIDTDAVRHLAAQLRRAADDADGLRGRAMAALVVAELPDDAGVAVLLHEATTELDQVARVLAARADQADYPLRDVVAVTLAAEVTRTTADLLQVLDPLGSARADGARAARRLRAAGARVDPTLLAAIEERSHDPAFALGFAGELPLAEVARVVLDADRAERSHPAASERDRARWAAAHRLLLAALGGVLGTASQLAHDPDLETAAWAGAITTETSGGRRAGQGAALALVLANGPFGDRLLAEVTAAVERYERTHATGSSPLWRPRAFVDGTYLGPLDPEGVRAYDPLATLLSALGSRPAAAQAFLGGGSTITVELAGRPTELPERLEYLIGRRRWPTDRAAGLGAALEAATTGTRNREDAGRAAARLASQVAALAGRPSGPGGGGWRAPDGLIPALTTILVSYMPDVFRAVQTDASVLRAEWFEPDDPAFPPGGPFGATFRRADLAGVVATIGTEPRQARRLLGAVLGTEELLLGHALDVTAAGDPGLAADFLTDVGGPTRRVSLALVDNAVSAGGQTLGFVVRHAYTGDRADQSRAAQAQRALSELLHAALSLPILPTPTGPWGELVVSQVTGRVFDAWAAGVPSDAATVYGGIDAAIAAQMRRQVLDQLADRGLLWPLVPIQGYEPPPDAAFMTDPSTGLPIAPRRFDPNTRAYQDWVTRYAPAAWLQVHIQLFYADAFPRIG